MIKLILANWKTSSLGLSAIILSLVHIAFCIKSGTLSEATLTVQIPVILGGIGLLAAGDAGKSQGLSDLQDKVDAIHKAVVTGDTSILTRQPDVPASKP